MDEVENIYEEYIKKQDEFQVYENRKGVCAGYANLFEWFMKEIDVEVENVSGHIRDERNKYVELESDDDFRHAWNVVKISGKWMIVDTTWGTSLNPIVSDYYFDVKPEQSIITHYPKNKKWQLLDKSLSLDEFNKSKFINRIWFFKGFSDIPKLKKDSKYYYYFIYKTNPIKEISIDLQFSADNLTFNSIQNITKIDQDGFTFLKFNKSIITKKAYFKVNLKKYGNVYYRDVINFKLKP